MLMSSKQKLQGAAATLSLFMTNLNCYLLHIAKLFELENVPEIKNLQYIRNIPFVPVDTVTAQNDFGRFSYARIQI